jgi:DNA-binding transcriptional ArsR family regulator
MMSDSVTDMRAPAGGTANFSYGDRSNIGVERAPLTPTEVSSVVTAITSAFGDPTRREIYLFAREHDDGVTAADVARRFDLHPNVARHHLDKLSGGGYLEVGVARHGKAGAGRPSKHYRVTEKEAALEIPLHARIAANLLRGEGDARAAG